METVRKENLILTTENKNIIILGGGSAGWMTAATLIKCFPDKKITVIESPNIPIVGVGESTLQFIRGWSSLLEVDDKEFLSKCNGTYKLSIKFNDFYKKGESFHYPFGDPVTGWLHVGVNDWWMKQMVDPQPQSDYAETLYPDKFALPVDDPYKFNILSRILYVITCAPYSVTASSKHA